MRQNLVILFLLGAFFFSCDQEKEPQPEAPIETEDEEPQIETDSADEYTNDLDPQDK